MEFAEKGKNLVYVVVKVIYVVLYHLNLRKIIKFFEYRPTLEILRFISLLVNKLDFFYIKFDIV